MTEPVQAPATPPTPPTARLRGPGAFRVLVVGVASIAIAIAAAVALSAGTAPALSPVSAVGPGPADADGFVGLNAEASTGPTSAAPGGPGMRGGGPGGQFHAITLTARNGNSLSLKTEDGWTRTITVDADTTYSRAGASITLNDLQVGDTIAFRQAKQTDGTFRISEVRVILPRVNGQVTAVTDTTITIKLRDGTSRVITVNGSTKYASGKDAATKADVKVDGYISAEGTTSGDTFTAVTVQVGGKGLPGRPGSPGGPGPGGPGGIRGGHGGGMPGMGGQKPNASAAPSASGTPG